MNQNDPTPNNPSIDPSWEEPVFAEALARAQAARCYRDLPLRQEKDWALAELEAARFRQLLDLEMRQTESEANGGLS